MVVSFGYIKHGKYSTREFYKKLRTKLNARFDTCIEVKAGNRFKQMISLFDSDKVETKPVPGEKSRLVFRQ